MTDEHELKEYSVNIQGYSAYAYSPRERRGNTGQNHIVVTSAIWGKLARDPYQALCRTNFWGLHAVKEPATCPKCLAIAERYDIAVVAYEDAIGIEAQS